MKGTSWFRAEVSDALRHMTSRLQLRVLANMLNIAALSNASVLAKQKL
jgi:hypothetical protein